MKVGKVDKIDLGFLASMTQHFSQLQWRSFCSATDFTEVAIQ